jgi:hypothetical protein
LHSPEPTAHGMRKHLYVAARQYPFDVISGDTYQYFKVGWYKEPGDDYYHLVGYEEKSK